MKFADAFLLLHLALITIGITAHEVASDTYVLIFINAALCITAWRIHRTGSKFRISESLATWICTFALVLTFFRGVSSATFVGIRLLDVRVSVVGQFLAVFQWVYIFKEKNPRDYVWSYLVTIIHMGTAGLQMPGIGFAFFFFLYALAGVCTLTAYNMWLEIRISDVNMTVQSPQLHKGFLARALLVTVVLMIPVSALFVVLPRRPDAVVMTAPRIMAITNVARPIAGFSETVTLGRRGTIQNNSNRVMQVKVYDADTNKAVSYPGMLLRGVALEAYEHISYGWVWMTKEAQSEWLESNRQTSRLDPIYAGTFPEYDEQPYQRVRCEVLMEPIRSRTVFAPFAPESVELPSMHSLRVERRQHHMEYRGRRGNGIEYTVTSRLYDLTQPSSGEIAAASVEGIDEYLAPYLMLPSNLSPRIAELARNIAPESECPDDYSKTIRIRDYLSDINNFSYTVKQEPTPGVEPVEDFLFNLKRGHCEYFASTLVVMLRSVGVPARVVNGFKMNEWNPIAGSYVVRQSNAHSWAEVYIRPVGWRSVDPSVMRDSVMPEPIFARRWYRHIYDTAETFWVQRVLDYTPEEQSTLLAPARGFLDAVLTRLAQGMNFFRRLRQMRFADLMRWLLIGVIVVIAAGLAAFMGRTFLRARGVFGANRRRSDPALRAFDDMERILTKRGYGRSPAQTPWEYRDMLATAAWPEPAALSLIITAFCKVRYAGEELSDAEAKALRVALDAIRWHAANFPMRKSRPHAGLDTNSP